MSALTANADASGRLPVRKVSDIAGRQFAANKRKKTSLPSLQRHLFAAQQISPNVVPEQRSRFPTPGIVPNYGGDNFERYSHFG